MAAPQREVREQLRRALHLHIQTDRVSQKPCVPRDECGDSHDQTVGRALRDDAVTMLQQEKVERTSRAHRQKAPS